MKKRELPSMFYGAGPSIFEKTKELRKNMTDAEKLLWLRLNKNQLGVRFRSQHPINIFIADFYCHEHRLVVEVDGGIHEDKTQKEHDSGRTIELERFEITVIRFTNEQVMNSINDVVSKIQTCLKN